MEILILSRLYILLLLPTNCNQVVWEYSYDKAKKKKSVSAFKSLLLNEMYYKLGIILEKDPQNCRCL